MKTIPIAAIGALPAEVQEHCLVDWRTVATILACKDVEHARKIVAGAGVPLVQVSDRRKLPRWGALREFIKSREVRS
jgi:hypothetical protein